MKRIPLRVSGAEEVIYQACPITQGIPFADGDLERGTPVRVVDENGASLPTQAIPLATWDKDLKFVRWLLVDFQADLKPGEPREFFLEYGPDVDTMEPEQPVRVDRKDACTILDTGVMRLELRHGIPDFFAACRIRTDKGTHDLFHGRSGHCLYMTDQSGTRYGSSTAGPAPTITVEDSGPLRVSVCIKGYHASKDGLRFCPYILRIHAYAGKADLRIFHTFIFDQEPHQIELAGIGMQFPLHLGDSLRAAVGGDQAAHWTDHCKAMEFLQADDRSYSVTLDGRPFGQGEKTRGWASLNGTLGGAVAVIRNSWQEYPKGFGLSQEGIDVRVWPENADERLVFTTPFEEQAIRFDGMRDEKEVKRLLAERPTAPLNLKSLNVQTFEDLVWVEKMLEKYAPDRLASHNDTGMDNGEGAAKTTELYLRLSPTAISDEEAERFARAVQEPAIAPADPAYACATKAMGGHFYHAGDPVFAEIDNGLDFLLESVAMEPIEKCRLYGMMRYGNMVCSHSPGPSVAYLHYKDTDPDRALRHVGPYNNEANDQIMGVWGNFLRTGRRDHFFLAQGYSRNVADVGICHTNQTNSWKIGLMHYHNAHQWSGGGSPSHTLVSGILTDYYTSGNRRLLEVAREVADWAVRTQEPCGIVSCRWLRLHREFTGPLWSLIEVYRATWEEKYGAVAERSLNWFLRTLPEDSADYPTSVYTRGERGDEAVIEPLSGCLGHARDIYHLYEGALRLFDSATLRKRIICEANHFVWEALTDNYVTAGMARKHLASRSLLWLVDDTWYWTQWALLPSFNGAIACLAYELTGDLLYAAWAKDQVMGTFRRQVDRCRHFADWRFTWLCFGSYIPRLMRSVADAMKRDPEGLAVAEEKWRRKRADKGMPVYTDHGVDLAKDRMGPNGQIFNRPPVDLPREAPPRSYEPQSNLGRLSTAPHRKPGT